ncbi:HNH endonuclease [Micromonospora chersina]
MKETPEGYTWHHHQDPGLMQLVEEWTHAKTGHTGGFSGRR